MIERSTEHHAHRRVKARPAHTGMTSSVVHAHSRSPEYAKPTLKSGDTEISGTVQPLYEFYPGE